MEMLMHFAQTAESLCFVKFGMVCCDHVVRPVFEGRSPGSYDHIGSGCAIISI
jgi:hypothetical protein